jgi:hypothetical protein
MIFSDLVPIQWETHMKHILMGIAALGLTACATGYKPQGFSGGFSEIPLAADAYQISVKGNGFTSESRVKEMGLLRSAELAKQNGYSYFILTGVDAYARTSHYTTQGSSTTTTTGSTTAFGYGNSATAYGSSTSYTTHNPGQTHTIIKPGVDIVVKFVPEGIAKEVGALSVTQIYGMYGKKYGLVD